MNEAIISCQNLLNKIEYRTFIHWIEDIHKKLVHLTRH